MLGKLDEHSPKQEIVQDDPVKEFSVDEPSDSVRTSDMIEGCPKALTSRRAGNSQMQRRWFL